MNFQHVEALDFFSRPLDKALSYEILIAGSDGVWKSVGVTDAVPKVFYKVNRSQNQLSGGDFVSFEIELEFYAYQLAPISNQSVENLEAFARGKWQVQFVPIGYPKAAFVTPRRLGFQVEGGLPDKDGKIGTRCYTRFLHDNLRWLKEPVPPVLTSVDGFWHNDFSGDAYQLDIRADWGEEVRVQIVRGNNVLYESEWMQAVDLTIINPVVLPNFQNVRCVMTARAGNYMVTGQVSLEPINS